MRSLVAIASLILGILGLGSLLLGLAIPYGGLFGLLATLTAMILGIVARKQLAARNEPTGMATAGMVLGIIGSALCALVIIVCATCFAGMAAIGKSIDTEAQQKLKNDPNFNKNFNDAFKKALEDAQKKQQQNK